MTEADTRRSAPAVAGGQRCGHSGNVLTARVEVDAQAVGLAVPRLGHQQQQVHTRAAAQVRQCTVPELVQVPPPCPARQTPCAGPGEHGPARTTAWRTQWSPCQRSTSRGGGSARRPGPAGGVRRHGPVLRPCGDRGENGLPHARRRDQLHHRGRGCEGHRDAHRHRHPGPARAGVRRPGQMQPARAMPGDRTSQPWTRSRCRRRPTLDLSPTGDPRPARRDQRAGTRGRGGPRQARRGRITELAAG